MNIIKYIFIHIYITCRDREQDLTCPLKFYPGLYSSTVITYEGTHGLYGPRSHPASSAPIRVEA